MPQTTTSLSHLRWERTMVATGKATLPPDDNGLKRRSSSCFTVNCDATQRRSDALFVEWRAKWESRLSRTGSSGSHLSDQITRDLKVVLRQGAEQRQAVRVQPVLCCIQKPSQVRTDRPVRPHAACGRRALEARGRTDRRATPCWIVLLQGHVFEKHAARSGRAAPRDSSRRVRPDGSLPSVHRGDGGQEFPPRTTCRPVSPLHDP